MHFELTRIVEDEDETVIHGVVRDLHDKADAHRYMGTPAAIPCMNEQLCPVESWVTKNYHAEAGLEPGTWILAFRLKDLSLLPGIRSGEKVIEVSKNAKGLIEFNINNVKKCVKVNKSMSETSAADEIDNLASGLIAKSGNALSPVDARIRIRKDRPDLAAREAEEYKNEQLLRTGLVHTDDDTDERFAAQELERLAEDHMKLNPALTLAEARVAARRQRPDLVVRIDAQRRAMVAESEESAIKDMKEAAEAIERLALLLMERTSFDIAVARTKIREQRPDLAERERGVVEVQKSRFL